MDAAWIGVVGAGVGGAIAVLGQWLIQRQIGVADQRAERRDAYLDFAAVANRGMRAIEDVVKLDASRVALQDQLDSHGILTPSNVAGIQQSLDQIMRDLERLRTESDSYMAAMDRALVHMQLVSPARVLEAGRRLHDAVNYYFEDRVTLDDMRARYPEFVSLAHIDLSSATGLRYIRLRRALHRFKGLPHRPTADSGQPEPSA